MVLEDTDRFHELVFENSLRQLVNQRFKRFRYVVGRNTFNNLVYNNINTC